MTQLQLSRQLARAFTRLDKALAAVEQAKRDVDAAFEPWSAGRRIDRDAARKQLASTGFLEPRKVVP